MATQVTNYQCPACMGPLHFTGESGRLECDYCGSSFNTAEIEALYGEKEANAAEAAQNAAEAEQATADGSDWDTSGLSEDWGADAGSIKAYCCPSCGAELLCDATTAATSCPYCGNPSVIPGQFSGALKPDFVLPFKLSKEDAIKALLTSSGNDAAIAIADTVGAKLGGEGGARAAFVSAMNAKAADLGCANTLFANPHGLDFNQYVGDMHSTARDVATMSAYAMKSQTFRDIVSKDKATITVTRGGVATPLELESTDELIGVYEGACGIKTGFTSLAGECFAGACNRGGLDLYAIVLNSSSEQQRFTDAKTLFDWVYANSVNYPYAHASETATMSWGSSTKEVPVVAEVAHGDWTDKTIKATFSEPDGSLDVFSLKGNVSCTMSFDNVSGNVHEGDKVGSAVFKQHNETIATVDLIACEDVAAPNPLEAAGIWVGRLLSHFTGSQTVATSVDLNDTPLINDKTKAKY